MDDSSEDDLIVIVVKGENEQQLDPSEVKSELYSSHDDQLHEIHEILQSELNGGEYNNIEIEQSHNEDVYNYNELHVAEQNILSSDDEPSNFPKPPVNRRKRRSFVRDLCSTNPEYEKNEPELVAALVTQLRSVQRPMLFDAYEQTDEGCFVCSVCSVEKPNIVDIEKHYFSQHGPKYHICLACGAGFRSNLYLYKHEKRCQSPDIRHVLAARAIVLGNRARAGRKPKGYQKQTVPCGKPFLCDLCPANFVAKASLLAHKHMHRAEKPYQCEMCPQAYTSKCVLYKHRLTHSDASFMCDHCGRTFNTKNKIISHMYSHLPPRYHCKECPKKYWYRGALLLHVHEVHRNLPPPCACKLCPKRFRRIWLLKDHMRKVHGMDLMTRRMFFKQFSQMTETRIENAKVVLRSEVPSLYLTDLKQDSESGKKELRNASKKVRKKKKVERNVKYDSLPTLTEEVQPGGGVVAIKEEANSSIKVVILDDSEIDYGTLSLQYQLSDYASKGRDIIMVENGNIKDLTDEEYKETLERLNIT